MGLTHGMAEYGREGTARMDDELLTIAEIAAVLRVTEQTVWNKLDRDEIPYVRIGERRLRVWRSDFDHWLARLPSVVSTEKYSYGKPTAFWEGYIADPIDPRRHGSS